MRTPICKVQSATATADKDTVQLAVTLHEGAGFVFEIAPSVVPYLVAELMTAAQQALKGSQGNQQ